MKADFILGGQDKASEFQTGRAQEFYGLFCGQAAGRAGGQIENLFILIFGQGLQRGIKHCRGFTDSGRCPGIEMHATGQGGLYFRFKFRLSRTVTGKRKRKLAQTAIALHLQLQTLVFPKQKFVDEPVKKNSQLFA